MTETKELPAPRGPVPVSNNVLTTFVRRLEAATSRLEDIASSSIGVDPEQLNGASPTGLGATAGASGSEAATPKAVESLPPSIQAFDKLLDTELKQWLELSSKLGSVITSQVC